jgi:hypothetical protein
MKLIFLHGMPAVGKLTVGRELAQLTGYRLFHNHLTVDLVSSVFEFGSPSFIELRERIWLDVFAEASRAQLPGLIFTFAFEPTVKPNFVERVKNVIEKNDGEVMFVKLICSPDELEKRLMAESRAKFGKLTSLDLFRELNSAGAFADPQITNDQVVIDTTHISPAEAAKQIHERIRDDTN